MCVYVRLWMCVPGAPLLHLGPDGLQLTLRAHHRHPHLVLSNLSHNTLKHFTSTAVFLWNYFKLKTEQLEQLISLLN